MRFRAEQHLRRQRDIKAVREQGRRYECGGFTLWYRQRPPEMAAPPSPEVAVAPELCRVCVIASTAAVGNAVARARAKRRLREVFRLHQSQLPLGFDLLLIARRSLNGLEYREIEKKFLEVCPRIQPRPA